MNGGFILQVVSGVTYGFQMSLQESIKCLAEECYVNVSSKDCPPNPEAQASFSNKDYQTSFSTEMIVLFIRSPRQVLVLQ